MEDNVKNEIVIYQNESGQIECKVNLHDKTIWISLEQISTVFKKKVGMSPLQYQKIHSLVD